MKIPQKPEGGKGVVSLEDVIEKQARDRDQATVVQPAAPEPKKEPESPKGEASAPAPAREKSPRTSPRNDLAAPPDVKVRKQAMSIQVPEPLYHRLKRYVDNYAKRHESMNVIICQSIEEKLDRLEKTKE